MSNTDDYESLPAIDNLLFLVYFILGFIAVIVFIASITLAVVTKLKTFIVSSSISFTFILNIIFLFFNYFSKHLDAGLSGAHHSDYPRFLSLSTLYIQAVFASIIFLIMYFSFSFRAGVISEEYNNIKSVLKKRIPIVTIDFDPESKNNRNEEKLSKIIQQKLYEIDKLEHEISQLETYNSDLTNLKELSEQEIINMYRLNTLKETLSKQNIISFCWGVLSSLTASFFIIIFNRIRKKNRNSLGIDTI